LKINLCLEKHNKTLEKKVETLLKLNQSLKKDVKAKDLEIDEITGELHQTEDKVISAEERLDESQSKLKLAETRVASLEERCKQLEGILNKVLSRSTREAADGCTLSNDAASLGSVKSEGLLPFDSVARVFPRTTRNIQSQRRRRSLRRRSRTLSNLYEVSQQDGGLTTPGAIIEKPAAMINNDSDSKRVTMLQQVVCATLPNFLWWITR